MKRILTISLLFSVLGTCGQQGQDSGNTSLLEQEGIISRNKRTTR